MWAVLSLGCESQYLRVVRNALRLWSSYRHAVCNKKIGLTGWGGVFKYVHTFKVAYHTHILIKGSCTALPYLA